jgi:hypothetical protein
MLLHRGLPPDAVFEPGKVVYPDDPYQAARNYGCKEPIDALLDGGQPAIYPTEKRICIETAGQITPLQTYEVGDVRNFFREGIAFPENAEVINDVKLRVALELWGESFTAVSANAKFLTLVMALEALATGTPRPQLVLDLQKKWKKEVEELQKTVSSDSADAVSLEALKNALQSRREILSDVKYEPWCLPPGKSMVMKTLRQWRKRPDESTAVEVRLYMKGS